MWGGGVVTGGSHKRFSSGKSSQQRQSDPEGAGELLQPEKNKPSGPSALFWIFCLFTQPQSGGAGGLRLRPSGGGVRERGDAGGWC